MEYVMLMILVFNGVKEGNFKTVPIYGFLDSKTCTDAGDQMKADILAGFKDLKYQDPKADTTQSDAGTLEVIYTCSQNK